MLKTVLAAAILSAASPSLAQETKPAAKPEQPAAKAEVKKLSVGDKAPALTIEKWVKGEPVTGFEKGKVYVVEFWATWCGPCIASMPHLSELQKEYKDDGLTIIGVTSADPNNTLEGVEKMAKDKGDTMGYTVAWDTQRKTNEAYMKAAGRGGIPCSFIVDKQGVIAYIGHPMAMDKTLEQVVAGSFDIEKAKADAVKAAESEAKLRPLTAKLRSQLGSEDWDAALATMDEILKADPTKASDLNMNLTRFNVLLKKKDFDAAYTLAGSIITGAGKDNAQLLNAIAWTIVDPDGDVETKNLDVAQQAADRAVELTKNKDAAILDTLATVHFLKGNLDKAIEIQTKAVELADEGPTKTELQGRLDEFKAAKKGKG